MKKKIIIVVSLVLAIAVAVFGLFAYQHQQKIEKAKQERDKYEKLFLYTGKWKIDSYEFLEDGRGVAVHWKSQTKKEDDLVLKYGSKTSRNYLNNIHGASNENYIVRENMKLDSYKPKIMSSKNNSENYYTLSIYKIANKKLEESEVDLYKLFAKYNANYVPTAIGNISEMNGKFYLPISTYESGHDLSYRKQVWMNLETKTIEWEDHKEDQNTEIPSVALGELRERLSDMNSKLNTISYYDWNHQNQIMFNKKYLKGSVLEKYSPKVYQLLSEKDSQFYILLDSKLENDRVYGNVQQFIDLYQLFVPDNTNLYEGITIPAELSSDGLVHQVNTKDEFDRYYDVQKDDELNKQRQVLVERHQVFFVQRKVGSPVFLFFNLTNQQRKLPIKSDFVIIVTTFPFLGGRIMKKGKLIILLAITSVIAGGVILTNQKKNIFTNDAQASKQLSAKEKQLAYLKEQEKDMADFVKSLSPKVDSVQFDWDSMEVGQVGNGTPQGGGYMLTLRGKVNQNEQTKFMVGFSLDNATSTPKEFGIYEMQPIRIYRDGGWYYYD